MNANSSEFSTIFEAMTGNQPFPWQVTLYHRFCEGNIPRSCDIATGLGKTSVMAVWLAARPDGARLPRRLVYVVDRRAVVDQATREAVNLRKWVNDNPDLKVKLGLRPDQHLPISTLRGQFVDNREWIEDPSAPAIIVGTVDMVGSRLLFEGYSVSRKMRPYHAGLLGADTLLVLDEAHLVPPFEMMLGAIVSPAHDNDFRAQGELAEIVPAFKLLSLSATGQNVDGEVIELSDKDLRHSVAKKRLEAVKRLSFIEADGLQPLPQVLADEAWKLCESGKANVRIIVFSNSRDDAKDALEAIEKHAKADKQAGREKIDIQTELFVGARRVREREDAGKWLDDYGFLAGSENRPNQPTFLFATSAGEVGVDLDADHMVCDLVQWERMVQRLGRVNRRGNGHSVIRVVPVTPTMRKAFKALNKEAAKRTKAERTIIEEAKCEVRRLRSPLEHLASDDATFDASPGAIRNLKIDAEKQEAAGDDGLSQLLHDATSDVPLRPALTRAIVDAWSMTSLEKHTGRPIVAPWLRGWVDEDPQTTVVWRRHLPSCERANSTRERQPETEAEKERLEADAREFFENAPVHLSETLETESFRVLGWLNKRAKAIKKQVEKKREKTTDDDTEQALNLDSTVGIILGRAFDVVEMLSVSDCLFDGPNKKDNSRRKEKLRRQLMNNTLVVVRDFCGLGENGLLKDDAKTIPKTADDDGNWSKLVGFRVYESEDGAASTEAGWQTCFRFVSQMSEEGEPTSFLIIEKWKDASSSEDSRSVSRTAQELAKHQQWAECEAQRLADRLSLSADYSMMLRIAARLHDEGKDCDRWQNAFSAKTEGRPYAKTLGPVRFRFLDGYRHEFGSLPKVAADPEFQLLNPQLQELCLHLVAAHHGSARPVIRTSGCDDPPTLLEVRAREVSLRFARLQRRWGPWGLAWWESLLRAADQRASRELENQEKKRNHG